MNSLPPCLCNKPQKSTWLKLQCSNCLGVLKDSQNINYSSQTSLSFIPSDTLAKSLLEYLSIGNKTIHKRSCTDKSQQSLSNLSKSKEKTKNFLRNPSEPLLIHKANQHSVPVCLYKTKETLKKEIIYAGHTNCVNAVNFIENRLWSVGCDYKLFSWNLLTSEGFNKNDYRTYNFSQKIHNRSITGLLIHAGDTLVTSSLDKSVKFWKISSKIEIFHSLFHRSGVKSISILPKHLISGTSDNSLHVWDIEKKERIVEYNEHIRPVIAIDNHRHTTFLSGSQDSSIKLWDIRTNHSISSFAGHFDEVSCIKNVDQYSFISSSKDFYVKTWDIRTLGVLDSFNTKQEVNSFDVFKDFIFVAGEKLQIWNKGKNISENHARAKCVKYCINNRSIIVGSYDNSVSTYKIMI